MSSLVTLRPMYSLLKTRTGFPTTSFEWQRINQKLAEGKFVRTVATKETFMTSPWWRFRP